MHISMSFLLVFIGCIFFYLVCGSCYVPSNYKMSIVRMTTARNDLEVVIVNHSEVR